MKISSSDPSNAVSSQPGDRHPHKNSKDQDEGHWTDDDTSGDFVLMGIPETELTQNVRKAIQHLLDDIQDLQVRLGKAQEEMRNLKLLADRDTLTPVMNRRAFLRELTRLLAQAKRYDQPASVIFFDVDDMKRLNDTYGHTIGDKALMHLAHLLVDKTRASDFVGRLGGDEFGVALPQTDFDQASELAARLARTIAEDLHKLEGEAISLSLSFGVYEVDPCDDATVALTRADAQRYRHKKSAVEVDD